MATITWYGAGVSSVAAGSRTVAGTGTGWLTEVAGLTPIKEGDKYGLHVGRPIVIEKIVSDTELLLADDWPGPTQTDAAYKIELTPPAIAAVEALRRLLASLSNGNLESLANITVGVDDIPIGVGLGLFDVINKSALGDVVGPDGATDNSPVAFDGVTGKSIKVITGAIAALHALVPAANKLPYFSAADTAALADLSAFARTILDDADAAAVRTTIGALSNGGGSLSGAVDLAFSAANWSIRQTTTITLAASSNFIFAAGSGLIIITDPSTGSTGVFLCGGGASVLLGQSIAGTFGVSGSSAPLRLEFSTQYYLANYSGTSRVLGITGIRTRNSA